MSTIKATPLRWAVRTSFTAIAAGLSLAVIEIGTTAGGALAILGLIWLVWCWLWYMSLDAVELSSRPETIGASKGRGNGS